MNLYFIATGFCAMGLHGCPDPSFDRAGAAPIGAVVQQIHEQQPVGAASPSGKYSIKVVPSTRSRGGKGLYRFKQDGRTVWERNLEFALEEVWINDEGSFGGYAYSAGLDGWGNGEDRESGGDLVLVVFDRDGAPTAEKRLKRRVSRRLHSPPEPAVAAASSTGTGNDVLVVTESGDQSNESDGTWRLALNDKKLIKVLTPDGVSVDHSGQRLRSLNPFPGTPLALFEWYEIKKGDALGVRFVLSDATGRSVAEIAWPSDYGHMGDDRDEDEFSDILDHGAVASVDDHKFIVHSFKDHSFVEFTWDGALLRESTRRPYARPKPAVPSGSVDWTRSPTKDVRIEATIRAEKSETSYASQASQIMVCPSGLLALLRVSTNKSGIVLIDRSGTEVGHTFLPSNVDPASSTVCACSVDATVFAVAVSDGTLNRTTVTLVDSKSGKCSTLATLRERTATHIVAGKGVVAVLGTKPQKYSSSETLTAIDRHGKIVWETVENGYSNTPGELFCPEDLAIEGHSVVVLQNIKHVVTFFNVKNGKFEREHALGKAWKTKPEYVTDLCRTKNGWIIEDFSDTDQFVLTDSNFKEIRRIQPHFDDGKTFAVIDGPVMTSDGAIWVLSEQAVLKLDGEGLVTKTLGARRQERGLSGIYAPKTNGTDTIYIGDEATGSVFAFDASSKIKTAFQVVKSDFTTYPARAQFEIDDTGNVFITSFDTDSDIEFSPDGHRLRVASLKDYDPYLDPDELVVNARPKGTRWSGNRLVDKNRKVLGVVGRRFDEHWLAGTLVESPDGTLFSDDLEGTKHFWSFYTSNGRPESMVTLEYPCETVGNAVCDGNNVYVSFKQGLAVFDKTGRALWHCSWPTKWDTAPELIGFLSLGRLVVSEPGGVSVLSFVAP